jgi:hypothetical protein
MHYISSQRLFFTGKTKGPAPNAQVRTLRHVAVYLERKECMQCRKDKMHCSNERKELRLGIAAYIYIIVYFKSSDKEKYKKNKYFLQKEKHQTWFGT